MPNEKEILSRDLDNIPLVPAENFMCAFRPTWRERLARKLFPTTYVETPEPTGFLGHGDVIFTIVRTNFSFLDRVRILLTGNVTCHVVTATEHKTGSHTVKAEMWPHAPELLTGEKP